MLYHKANFITWCSSTINFLVEKSIIPIIVPKVEFSQKVTLLSRLVLKSNRHIKQIIIFLASLSKMKYHRILGWLLLRWKPHRDTILGIV